MKKRKKYTIIPTRQILNIYFSIKRDKNSVSKVAKENGKPPSYISNIVAKLDTYLKGDITKLGISKKYGVCET